jgi:hypothetical protein
LNENAATDSESTPNTHLRVVVGHLRTHTRMGRW